VHYGKIWTTIGRATLGRNFYFSGGRAACVARSASTFLSPHTVSYDKGRIENTASNNSSIVARVFVVTGTCLLTRCMATTEGTHRHKGDLTSPFSCVFKVRNVDQ
jgi:hypothetical protein